MTISSLHNTISYERDYLHSSWLAGQLYWHSFLEYSRMLLYIWSYCRRRRWRISTRVFGYEPNFIPGKFNKQGMSTTLWLAERFFDKRSGFSWKNEPILCPRLLVFDRKCEFSNDGRVNFLCKFVSWYLCAANFGTLSQRNALFGPGGPESEDSTDSPLW